MNVRAFAIVVILCVSAVLIGGCCGGMDVEFRNETDRKVPAEFVTQGGRTDMGVLEPGQRKSVCKRFDEELLPAYFSITVFGGTPETLTEIVEIPKDYPDELNIWIYPGPELEVRDEEGRLIPFR